jgi:hypothetical protein
MPVNKRLFLFAYTINSHVSITKTKYCNSKDIIIPVGEVDAGGPAAAAPAAAAEAPVAQWLPKRRSRNGSNGNKAYVSVRFVATTLLHKKIGLHITILIYVRGTST